MPDPLELQRMHVTWGSSRGLYIDQAGFCIQGITVFEVSPMGQVERGASCAPSLPKVAILMLPHRFTVHRIIWLHVWLAYLL
jgi:hypothetical protein